MGRQGAGTDRRRRRHASEMLLQCSFGMSLLLTRAMTERAREALTRALMLAREIRGFRLSATRDESSLAVLTPRGGAR